MNRKWALILLLLLFLGQSLVFVAANQEIDYEQYDRSAESLGFSRPTHLTIQVTEIRDGSVAVPMEGKVIELREGDVFQETYRSQSENTEETLFIRLELDARAYRITGEFDHTTITETSSPPSTSFPQGTYHYNRKRTLGQIKGQLTSSSEREGLDTGHLNFVADDRPREWEIISRMSDDGGTEILTEQALRPGQTMGALNFRVEEVYAVLESAATTVVDNFALGTAGETSAVVVTTLVLGLAGVGAAAAGAAGAGLGVGNIEPGMKEGESQRKSQFQMVFYKSFGNRVRYDANPVTVCAKMVQISEEGQPKERPDLTQMILITSGDGVLTVSNPTFNGEYMTSQVQALSPPQAESKADQGVISFAFSGEGGSFQQNTAFHLVGEGRIELEKQLINLLDTSTEGIEVTYKLHDFMDEVNIRFEAESPLFKVEAGKNQAGDPVLIISPTQEARARIPDKFVQPFSCEMTAYNAMEQVTQAFVVQVCHEGIGTAYDNHPINTTKEPLLIHIHSEKEEEGIQQDETAFLLPLTVMIWNEKTQELMPDMEAAKSLQMAFSPDPQAGTLEESKAAEVIRNAAIQYQVTEKNPEAGLDSQLKPVVYEVEATQRAVAEVAELELLVRITTDKESVAPLVLKGILKPHQDFKAMIKWFLEYPQNTFIDRYIKLGDVNIFHNALDFIEERVYPLSAVRWARIKGNHYEDATGDPLRKKSIILHDQEVPQKIGEFKNIQSLFHELIHVVEDQNGDVSYLPGGAKSANSYLERHSYYLQYLSDALKALTDLEKNPSINIVESIKNAIGSFDQAHFDSYFDPTNNFSPRWFGAQSQNQHYVFGQYSHYDIYNDDPAISPERKKKIAETVRRYYFPGRIFGRFTEQAGFFQGAVWSITWGGGELRGLRVEHPAYRFRESRPPEWMGGNQMMLTVIYDVECLTSGKTDILSVDIDAGTFDPMSHHYPTINQFNVKWNATYKISDGIMGVAHNQSAAVKG